MKGELEVRVALERLPLSRASVRTLQHLDRYDAVIFTSKNATNFFIQEIRRHRQKPPRIIQVGPRGDLLKVDLRGQRVLFPRSAIAPFDIVRKLRARGTVVRVVALYTAKGVPLSGSQKKRLLNGDIRQLYFKSPSGVQGFVRQFRGKDRVTIFSISARCIGRTTATAARKAGFRKVFIR
jgi:uroporphyrinogen-III synthase